MIFKIGDAVKTVEFDYGHHPEHIFYIDEIDQYLPDKCRLIMDCGCVFEGDEVVKVNQ